MSDFWQRAIEEQIEAPPERENVPVNAWILAKTTTAENGGWAPKVKTFDRKNRKEGEAPTFNMLNMGVIVLGGDAKVPESAIGRYVPFSRFVHPGEKEPANMPCGGALLGFLTAALCPGVGDGLVTKDLKGEARRDALAKRTNLRKVELFGKLSAKADELGWTIDNYAGDGALYIASTACELLKDEARYILGLVVEDKDATGKVRGAKVSQVLDYVQENVAKNKVVAGAEAPAPYGGAAAVVTF